MDNGKEETGRKKVRMYFLDPLNEAGMVRKRTDTAEKHKKTMTALADKLAYMTPDNLRGLRQCVVRLAGGKARNVWPCEQSVEFAAYNLQTPPPRKGDYAQSLVRSAMGRRANDEGWVVELFQIAKRIGPPPGKYIISKLKEEAVENRGRRARVAEYIKSGSESAHDRAWLAQYHRDLDECLAIMNEKPEEAEA
jgi:hypothetical protein